MNVYVVVLQGSLSDDEFLSFLDTYGSDAYVEKLFNFRMLVLQNEDPDCRVLELSNKYQLENVTKTYFKTNNVVQVVLPNPMGDPMCPFIMLIMENYVPTTVVNYKLETLFRKMGINGIHAHCTVALVMGMMTPLYMDSMVDIPEFFRLCNLTFFDRLGDIELTIEKSIVRDIARRAGYDYPDELPQLGFVLLGPCHKCSKGKVSCTKLLPCSRCNKTNCAEDMCQFSIHERQSRCKVLLRSINAGMFGHCDLVRYQLHLQSCMYELTTNLKRGEAKDIFDRIHGNQVVEAKRIDYDATQLPQVILDMIKDKPNFKIEWMDNGRYTVKASLTYKKNFLPNERLIELAKKGNIPPKLIDTCNMNEFDMAYSMWLETVVNPGVIVRYTGTAFWSHDRILADTSIKMVTVIMNPMSMVTATVVGKSQIYVMP